MTVRPPALPLTDLPEHLVLRLNVRVLCAVAGVVILLLTAGWLPL